MQAADQAAIALQVIMAVGPLALYFLTLGLVNSQARPRMVDSRLDFILLAVAFLPLFVAPTSSLLAGHRFWLAGSVAMAVLVLYLGLLPLRHRGWVIYNVGPGQCRRIIERACQKLDWQYETTDEGFILHPMGIRVRIQSLLVLRNVTLEIHSTDPHWRIGAEQLKTALQTELARESMLPSPTGAALVLAGTLILGLPTWYLLHNMDAIVEALRHFLFA